jgi:uncharacterized glyoxalase superfamily protein PhnB
VTAETIDAVDGHPIPRAGQNRAVDAAFPFPDVVPYLYYRDATVALEFLVAAFDFTVHSEVRGADRSVLNAQLRTGSGLVMIGPAMADFGTAAIEGPGPATSRIHVLVPDVDAHRVRAGSAGATIHTEPMDFDRVRIYIAVDPGHHQWIFAQPIDALP